MPLGGFRTEKRSLGAAGKIAAVAEVDADDRDVQAVDDLAALHLGDSAGDGVRTVSSSGAEGPTGECQTVVASG